MRISFCLLSPELNLVADSANYWCKAHDLDFTVVVSLWSLAELYCTFELFNHTDQITLLCMIVK